MKRNPSVHNIWDCQYSSICTLAKNCKEKSRYTDLSSGFKLYMKKQLLRRGDSEFCVKSCVQYPRNGKCSDYCTKPIFLAEFIDIRYRIERFDNSIFDSASFYSNSYSCIQALQKIFSTLTRKSVLTKCKRMLAL